MAKTKKQDPIAGFRINTPADFCSALGAHSHSITTWTRFRGEREQLLRRTLDEIFKDLPFVDALDSDSVADFLDGIEVPLESIQQMGLQLFVVTASGKSAAPAIVHAAGKQIADWRHNCYVVAPDPAFYWLDSTGSPRTVHVLTGLCHNGLMELSSCPDKAVHVYPTVGHLSGAFEGEIPWCPVCFLESTQHSKP